MVTSSSRCRTCAELESIVIYGWIYALRSGANRTDGNPAAWNGDAAAADALVVERVLPSPAPPSSALAQVDQCRTIVLRSGVPR